MAKFAAKWMSTLRSRDNGFVGAFRTLARVGRQVGFRLLKYGSSPCSIPKLNHASLKAYPRLDYCLKSTPSDKICQARKYSAFKAACGSLDLANNPEIEKISKTVMIMDR